MLKCFSTTHTSVSRYIQSPGVCTLVRLWVRRGAGAAPATAAKDATGGKGRQLLKAYNKSHCQAAVDKIFTCYMPLIPRDCRSDKLSQGSARELRRLGWICYAASPGTSSYLGRHFCLRPYTGTHRKYDPVTLNANCIQMYWIRKDQRLSIIKQREPNTYPVFDCFFFYHLKILLKLLLL